jgi:hypothetical protein
VNAEQLRNHLLEVLEGADAPMSTTQARLAVTEYCRRLGRPVVAEEVYRALVILARRGQVCRAANPPGRSTHWKLTRRLCASERCLPLPKEDSVICPPPSDDECSSVSSPAETAEHVEPLLASPAEIDTH